MRILASFYAFLISSSDRFFFSSFLFSEPSFDLEFDHFFEFDQFRFFEFVLSYSFLIIFLSNFYFALIASSMSSSVYYLSSHSISWLYSDSFLDFSEELAAISLSYCPNYDEGKMLSTI